MIQAFLERVRSGFSNLPSGVLVPGAIALTCVSITGTLASLRSLGVLERLELTTYDQMMRSRPDRAMSDRLLIVGISEKDIQSQKRFPLSDQTIATALRQLQVHRPRVIGLDLYRDFPYEPGHTELVKQLQQPNVIAITKLADSEDIGVPPPASVPPERVGFNDILTDPDGVVRRSLLYAEADYDHAFAMRVTLAYLKKDGIRPITSKEGHLQLGKSVIPPLEQTDGQYQKLDAAGYQTLLDYQSRQQIAPQVSLTQVLQGKVNPTLIRDRIVLIGTTARSNKDVFVTPYSASDRNTSSTPGVVVHGQAVLALLDSALTGKSVFWFWDEWQELIWLGFWSLLGGTLAWFVRNPFMFGLTGTVTILTLLGIGYGVFLKQGWIPVAVPTLGFGATAVLVVIYRAQQAHRQQQMTMKLLGQNTSPEIATALWQSRDRLLRSGKLPGQKLIATMLLTDIKNFSTISEQMLPENLLEWLNEYLSVITHEVRSRQGIINKFTGDGMLAVFGVPVNRTTPVEISHDAQQAVACAMAMGDRLRELNQNWQLRGLPTIEMRVGIFTGPVVVGSLGGKDRLEYGVIGDSVNIAARLESYEKVRQSDLCRVLIAKETLIHLQDKFVVEAWGPLELKGKRQKVEVYRVLHWAEGSSDELPGPGTSPDDLKNVTKAV